MNTVICRHGKTLTISPVRDQKAASAFKTALDKVNRKHGKTLRRLAG